MPGRLSSGLETRLTKAARRVYEFGGAGRLSPVADLARLAHEVDELLVLAKSKEVERRAPQRFRPPRAELIIHTAS
jgi:hypothetical protein